MPGSVAEMVELPFGIAVEIELIAGGPLAPAVLAGRTGPAGVVRFDVAAAEDDLTAFGRFERVRRREAVHDRHGLLRLAFRAGGRSALLTACTADHLWSSWRSRDHA